MRTWSKTPATWAVIFGVLIAGLAVYTVYGQEADRQPGQQGRQPSVSAQPGMSAQPGAGQQYSPKLINANKLIGKDVKDNKGQKIGTVEDVVLDSSRQRVGFVVISTGGVLGMGQKFYAVPWRALKAPMGDEPVTFNATKEQFQNAPQFDKANWPNSGDPVWRQSMQYWHQQMGATGGMDRGRTGEWDRSKSGDMDRGKSGDLDRDKSGAAPSDSSSGGTTGDQSGMSSGGTTGDRSGLSAGSTGDRSSDSTGMSDRGMTGDRSMTGRRDMSSEDQMGMDSGAQTPMKYRRLTQIIGLNVKDYRGDQIGEIENVMIDADHAHVAYAIIGHGGFLKVGEKLTPVPWSAVQISPQNEVARVSTDRQTLDRLAISEDQLTRLSDPTFSSQLARDFGQEPYWVTYGYVSPEGAPAGGSFDAWKPGSTYNKNFQAGKIESHSGTVEGVGTFTPERGAAEGLRLRLRTDQGQTITVHAGPWAYAQQQGFSSLYGQKATVSGARSTVNGREVLIATKIESAGKTWELRDEKGAPKWNVDQLQSPSGRMGERYPSDQMSPKRGKPGEESTPKSDSDKPSDKSSGGASPWSAG